MIPTAAKTLQCFPNPLRKIKFTLLPPWSAFSLHPDLCLIFQAFPSLLFSRSTILSSFCLSFFVFTWNIFSTTQLGPSHPSHLRSNGASSEPLALTLPAKVVLSSTLASPGVPSPPFTTIIYYSTCFVFCLFSWNLWSFMRRATAGSLATKMVHASYRYSRNDEWMKKKWVVCQWLWSCISESPARNTDLC